MQKKLKSLNITVAAVALMSVLSISSFANSKQNVYAELKTYSVSFDLVMLATLAKNDGWEIMPNKTQNSIELKKTLKTTRMLSGVRTRWKRVSENYDAVAVASVDNGKITISSKTSIEDNRYKEKFSDSIQKLQDEWQQIFVADSAK